MPFSEADDGGFGGGAVESTLMMEQFGHGLVIEHLSGNRGAGGWCD